MPVSPQTPVADFLANGVTSTFAYAFQVLRAETLVVSVNGAVQVGIYTVSGLEQQSGSVTLSVPPSNGAAVRVRRVSPLRRDTDYQQEGDLRAQVIDNDFDSLWLAMQEMAGSAAGLLSCLRAPSSETLSELPAASVRALKVLTFNGAGQPLTVAPASGSATELATLLANSTSASNGAAMVAFNDALTYPAGSVGRALSVTGSATVPNVAALRAIGKGTNKVIGTAGFYQPLDDGHAGYFCDIGDTTSADNGTTVIVGVDGGRWKLLMQTEYVNSRQLGVRGDGQGDESAALLAADAIARAVRKPLLIRGAPRITSTVTLTAKTHWIFGGASESFEALPSSYIIKASTLNGPGIVIAVSSSETIWQGGGVYGQPGNTGDGIQVHGNSFRWLGSGYIYGCGTDGIRIGKAAAPSNANCFYIEGLNTSNNGRHGMNIDDKPFSAGGPDANAGVVLRMFSHHNGQCGLRLGNARLGNVFIGFCLENNTTGLFMDSEAQGNVFVGGDIEANTGPLNTTPLDDVQEVIPFNNRFLDVTVSGVIRNTSHNTALLSGLTVRGESIAGAMTAVGTPTGVRTFTGGAFVFKVDIQWSAHTRAGIDQMSLEIPIPTGTSIDGRMPAPIPAVFTLDAIYSEGFATPAGSHIVGVLRSNSSPPRVVFYLSNAGVISSLLVPASGRIIVGGTVPIYAL